MIRFSTFFKISNENLNIIKSILSEITEIVEIVDNTIFFNDFDDSIEMLKNISSELFLDVLVSDSGINDEESLNWLTALYKKANLKGFVSERDLLIKTLDNSLYTKKRVFKKYINDFEMNNCLKVFLECDLNTSKASKELFMHRNTLINKLEKFYLETNYDPKSFKDAFILYNLIK